MSQYTLTEQEARALATQIASGLNRVGHNEDYDEWFKQYMRTYNEVMTAIDKYNQSIGS